MSFKYTLLSLALLSLAVSLSGATLTVTLSPTFNALDTGMTIHFTNGTYGIYPANATSWAYHINGTDYNLFNNNITFLKAGNYLVSLSAVNSGNYNISANSLVEVAKLPSVAIYPSLPTAVFGQSLTLQANVSGGTSPYAYQWYIGSNAICGQNALILNATQPAYSVNTLNGSQEFCVTVNDTYNKQSQASVNTNILYNLDTNQGEVISVADHVALVAPTISASNNSYIASNTTPYALLNISLPQCGGEYQIYETALTPSYSNLSISNTPYGLYPNQPQPYGNGNCYVELLNISWVPEIQTSILKFYYQPLATTTSTSTTSLTTSIPTTIIYTTSVSSVSTSIPSTTSIPKTTSTITSNAVGSSGKKAESDNGILIAGVIVIIALVVGIFGWKVWQEYKKL